MGDMCPPAFGIDHRCGSPGCSLIAMAAIAVTGTPLDTIQSYVKSKLNKNVEREGFAISVSYSQFHMINKMRSLTYMSFQFSDFDEIRAYNDLFQVWLDDRKVEFGFQTESGFQIIKVIAEYEYLEIELQNLEEP